MTLKAGTVCYIVSCTWPEVVGRVVTLTWKTSQSGRGLIAFEFEPEIETWWGTVCGAEREHLRPINDPDQPVDVTSDADEPVTV